MLKTKRKLSLLRFSPVFGPKFGENQKPKKSFVRFCPFVCLNFVPNQQRGGGMPHFSIPFYSNYTILATQKGGDGTMAPPKYAPAG